MSEGDNPNPPTTEIWLDKYQLDDSHKEALKKYTSIEEALKGGAEASRLIGKQVVDRLKEKPELLKESGLPSTDVLKMLGAPADVNGYGDVKFTLPDDLPDDIKQMSPPEMVQSFKEACAKVQLLPSQVQALLDWNAERVKAEAQVYTTAFNERQQAVAEAEGRLKTLWGGDFDKNLDMATRAAKEYGGDTLAKQIADPANTELRLAMAQLAKLALEEGDAPRGEQIPDQSGKSVFDYEDMDGYN